MISADYDQKSVVGMGVLKNCHVLRMGLSIQSWFKRKEYANLSTVDCENCRGMKEHKEGDQGRRSWL